MWLEFKKNLTNFNLYKRLVKKITFFKVYGYYQVSCACYLGSIPNFENFDL